MHLFYLLSAKQNSSSVLTHAFLLIGFHCTTLHSQLFVIQLMHLNHTLIPVQNPILLLFKIPSYQIPMSSRCLILLLFLSFTVHAKPASPPFLNLNLSPVVHTFQPIQLGKLTLYKAADSLKPAQCAGSIITFEGIAKCTKSKNAMYVLPHSAIMHEGVRCGTGKKNEYVILIPGEQLSDPRTAFINGLGPLFSLLQANARAVNAFRVLQGIDVVIVGFEFSASRICGGVERFPKSSIYFFFHPPLDDLHFGFAYVRRDEVGMISLKEDEEVCMYKETRFPGPGQPPFSTPTPSPSPGRDLTLPANLYDLTDPEEMDPCFPVTSVEPYIPPSPRPSPSVAKTPNPTPSTSISSAPTPSQSVSATPSPSIGTSQSAIPVSETPSTTPSETPGEDDGPGGDRNGNENGVCFPSIALVELEGERIVPISRLKVGDRVLVRKNVYSDVFLFTHHADDVFSTFINATVRSNLSLTLSPAHYVPVAGKLKAAWKLTVGDTITLGNGKSDVVISLKKVMLRGLHNPQTLDGDIVVNGIVASTYTQSVDPSIATSLLAPVRLLYKLVGVQTLLSKLFCTGNNFFAALLPDGQPM